MRNPRISFSNFDIYGQIFVRYISIETYLSIELKFECEYVMGDCLKLGRVKLCDNRFNNFRDMLRSVFLPKCRWKFMHLVYAASCTFHLHVYILPRDCFSDKKCRKVHVVNA